jgi:hypothetical protein
MLMGAKIALEQAGAKAGGRNVKLVSVDNSLAASGKWDAYATSSAARKALQDESTIAYRIRVCEIRRALAGIARGGLGETIIRPWGVARISVL